MAVARPSPSCENIVSSVPSRNRKMLAWVATAAAAAATACRKN
jgi:hypothetical protein